MKNIGRGREVGKTPWLPDVPDPWSNSVQWPPWPSPFTTVSNNAAVLSSGYITRIIIHHIPDSLGYDLSIFCPYFPPVHSVHELIEACWDSCLVSDSLCSFHIARCLNKKWLSMLLGQLSQQLVVLGIMMIPHLNREYSPESYTIRVWYSVLCWHLKPSQWLVCSPLIFMPSAWTCAIRACVLGSTVKISSETSARVVATTWRVVNLVASAHKHWDWT